MVGNCLVSNASRLALRSPHGVGLAIAAVLAWGVATGWAAAGEPPTDATGDLAKKLQNPLANLISVPFQFNVDFGIGDKDASKFVLNIQPVIPISIREDWNVITRTIVPVVHAESPANGISSETGLGDVVQSFFFSPKEPVNGWVIGAGPILLWPTATETALGSAKWGAGPTAVVLRQDRGWTYGLLASHTWSYAGDEDRDHVNSTYLQPFLSYTFPTRITLGINTESAYDWTDRQWSVPINVTVSQVLKVGQLPISIAVGPKIHVQRPDGGPDWGIRFTVTLLFPR